MSDRHLVALLRSAQIRSFTVDLSSAYFSGDIHIRLHRLTSRAGAIVEIHLKDAPLSELLDVAMNTICTFPVDPDIAKARGEELSDA